MSAAAEELELDRDDAPDSARTFRKRAPRTEAQKAARRQRDRRRRETQRSETAESLEGPIRVLLQQVGGVWHLAESARGIVPGPDGKLARDPDLAHPQPTCGELLVQQAPDIAAALNAVAADDPAVHRWLTAMMVGGGWGAVGMAVLPLAAGVYRSHVVPGIARRRGLRVMYEEEEQLLEEQPAPYTERPPIAEEEQQDWTPPNVIRPEE